MPKMVPTISTTVIRDGKRKPVVPGVAFPFTKDEVEELNRLHPGALRKPINETGNDDPEPTDESAPEREAGATATNEPKTDEAADAAKKKSSSKKATSGSKAPKSTDAAPKVDSSADEGERENEEGDEDEDI